MHTRSSDLVDWLRERVTAAGARGLVVGLSGGVDSAVVAALCRMALPDDVLGVLLPCYSEARDEADAQLVASYFQIPTIRVDLGPAYDRLTTDLTGAVSRQPARPMSRAADEVDAATRVALANVQPRLRMTSLYFLANSLDYLVAGTSNRCELTIGYFTKFGDAADLLPIGDLLESDVRDLARDLGVPATLLEREPGSGLRFGQTAEDEMGFTYAQLERYLALGPEAVPPAVALRIERMVRQTAHKRCMAPTPRATSREADSERWS